MSCDHACKHLLLRLKSNKAGVYRVRWKRCLIMKMVRIIYILSSYTKQKVRLFVCNRKLDGKHLPISLQFVKSLLAWIGIPGKTLKLLDAQ
jgi:hypothetical protein